MALLGKMVVAERIDIPWWVVGVAGAVTVAAYFFCRWLAKRV